MQNPKEILSEKLKWILGEMGVFDIEPEVSLVSNPQFGDFSTNAAMVSFKEIPDQARNDIVSNPRELAERIVSKLKESRDVNVVFEKIEVAGPGFINFYLSSKYLSQTLQKITRDETFLSSSRTKNPQKVIVEFGDPNPFKEIHIGHLRNLCIGESFSRLLEAQGNEVTRANYQGDVGLHVAKCLWGLMNNPDLKSQNSELNVESLAKAYAYGATEFENNENAKQEIIEINRKIYSLISHPELVSGSETPDQARGDLRSLWQDGRKVSLEHFEEIYKRVGVQYDKYYFESVTAKKGKEVVLSHIDDGIFEKDEGAVIYRGEKDGFHTRVFLTKEEYATYEGKDLALAILKSEEEHDKSIILTGNEQAEYFQVMLSALRKIAPRIADETNHLTYGHVRLREGKMSSRTGDVITAEWLMDEAVKRVKEAFPEMDDETSEKVGVGAVKYSMLKFSIPSDIHFDFNESISIEGNSGPYLQYTYVRTQSVLEKFKILNLKFEMDSLKIENSKLKIEEEELLRFLTQYPYHSAQAAEEFAPNLLCNYLFELSQKFNLFYQKHKIIGSENENFRLDLTKATGKVLKNGLSILGINTVEKM